jgi:hypothetical protein
VGFYDNADENRRKLTDIQRSGMRLDTVQTNSPGSEAIAWTDGVTATLGIDGC